MTKSIILEVSHPDRAPGKIDDFNFFWAYYVSGYRSDKHCQPCFRGSPVPEFNTSTAQNGLRVELNRMDKFPYLYVCGVGSGPRKDLRHKNFHLALRHEEGKSVSAATFNGYVITAHNTVMLQIPALPKDWKGLDDEHTRCKNFQFAVEYFGYPSPPHQTGTTSPT